MAYTTIDKPSEHFNTGLYTGNATNPKAITGVGFQPDWVWIKDRDFAYNHQWHDVVRGADNALLSNLTSAEADYDSFVSFDTDGFSVTGANGTNNSGNNHVAWNWKGGGTASSNSNGSITSSVSANATAGFSIVSWTGDGTDATIGHGLSSAPKLIIHKHRSGTVQWNVYADVTGAGTGGYLRTDSNNAWASNSGFFGTAPTATVFSPGSHPYMSGSGNDNIAYCFTDVKGYCKIGQYVGNGSTDGPFIYTGFKPALTITKTIDTTGHWQMFDNKRSPFNEMDERLKISDAAAEDENLGRDFLSNGFKIRNNNATINGSGVDMFYIAFAENPLVTSTGVPATAR